MDEIISSVAIGIGFIQLYQKLQNVDELDISAKDTILLGISANVLWLIYQYRKHGMSMTTLYTSAGLLVQLYLLNRILLKEKIRE